MTPAPRADAFVFFGATGDLAFKKIFPALQAMIRRGHLDVPIIGVAKAGWTLERLRAARAGEPAGARRWGRRSRLREARRSSCATSTATTTTARPSMSSRRQLEGAIRPLHYLAIPPSMFPRGRSSTWAARAAPGTRG